MAHSEGYCSVSEIPISPKSVRMLNRSAGLVNPVTIHAKVSWQWRQSASPRGTRGECNRWWGASQTKHGVRVCVFPRICAIQPLHRIHFHLRQYPP